MPHSCNPVIALLAIALLTACVATHSPIPTITRAPTGPAPITVSPPTASATSSGPTTSFAVMGAVQTARPFTLADLQALPVATLSAETRTRQGSQGSHQYTGALLKDVLDQAKLRADPNRKNDTLNRYIVARGSDGYVATIAYGEVDPDFGNQQIIVAYTMDGKPLDKDGVAELVVPGDKLAGRWVKNLASLTVGEPAQ